MGVKTEKWRHKDYPAIRVVKPKPKRKPAKPKVKEQDDGN